MSGCSGSDTGSPGSSGGNSSTGIGGSGGIAGTPTGGAPGVGGNGAGGGNNTGGVVATGGTTPAGGSPGLGGAPNTGGSANTGGSKSTGGTIGVGGTASTGGSPPTGGAVSTGGSKSVGGTTGTGGTKATGGTVSTGGSQANGGSGGSTSPDPTSTISNWMNTCLPYGNPTGTTRTQIIQAIIDACNEFGPPPSLNPGWQMQYCWAHLLGAILKESSYNVTSINEAGTDPTVGLTQIRFSSTVCDFYTGGPLASLQAMGCQFPADFAAHASESCSSTFWKTTGGDAAHTAWMETPSCNVGLGAWYYYTYATDAGTTDPNVVPPTHYLYDFCHGAPVGADLATGLLSHLRGPSGQWASIPNLSSVPSVGTDYVTAIKTVMDCALGTVSGTHPLFIKLTPNPTQYCK